MTEPENATMLADLRAVDEALASGAAGAEDIRERELQELALALRAESPEPSAGFAADLRGRVEAGFPRERRLPRPALPGMPKLRRPPLPVLGGVASVLLAVAVAVALTGRSDDDVVSGLREPARDSGGGAARQLSRGGPESKTLESAPQTDIAPAPPAAGAGFAPGESRRRIERSAALTLAAPEDRIDNVADGIIRLTDRHRGFVLRSSLSSGDEGTTGGDFELRIPADRLQAALAGLSKLADVRARTQSGQDVTREYASAAERLEVARAERRSLLRRLERAPNDSAAEAIRRRLDLVAGEIRGLRSQVRDLRTRTDYASVTVTLQADEDGGGSSPDPGSGIGGAVDDAVESLSDSVEIAIRVLGVLLPLGLLGTGALLGARAVRRRRREATLG